MSVCVCDDVTKAIHLSADLTQRPQQTGHVQLQRLIHRSQLCHRFAETDSALIQTNLQRRIQFLFTKISKDIFVSSYSDLIRERFKRRINLFSTSVSKERVNFHP